MRHRHCDVCGSVRVAFLALAAVSALVTDAFARAGIGATTNAGANDDGRGSFTASCSLFNPCNADLNLTCQPMITNPTEKRCSCAQHTDPTYVFTFDLRTGACVPVLKTEKEAALRCEDVIEEAKAMKAGLNGSSSCKSHHECQVTNAIPYSRCNLDTCQCECVPEAKPTKAGSCVPRRRLGESCSNHEECDVKNSICVREDNNNGTESEMATGICECEVDFVWKTYNTCVVAANAKKLEKSQSFNDTNTRLAENSTHHPAVDQHKLSTLGKYLITALALLLVLALIFILVVWRLAGQRQKRAVDKQGRKRKNKTQSALSSDYLDRPATATGATILRSRRIRRAASRVPEISMTEVTIDYNRELGRGKGGIVYAGRYGTTATPVAIKTLNQNSLRSFDLYVDCMEREIDIFKLMPEHDNIIKLLAYSHAHFAGHEPRDGGLVSLAWSRPGCYLILELCALGNLQTFLRNSVYIGSQTYVEQDLATREQYTDLDLLHFAHQIATAEEFLAIHRVVHNDLALRNVLLATRHQIKIADFGLARTLGDESPHYIKKKHDPLPWKWSPPEVLLRNEFSTQSDAWAFGVTMWEMYSKGREPYDRMEYRRTIFAEELYRGLHRLPQPELATTELYRLMKKCWHSEPSQRIGFSELKLNLSRMINQPMLQQRDTDTQLDIGDDGYLLNSAQVNVAP